MSEKIFKINEEGEIVETFGDFCTAYKTVYGTKNPIKKAEPRHSYCSECIHAKVCVDYENGDEVYDLEDCQNYIREKTTVIGVVFCKDCIYLLDGARIGMCGYFCKRLCRDNEYEPVYADDFCSRGVSV